MRFQIIALLALSLQETEQTLFFLGPLLNLFGGGGIGGGGAGGGLLGGLLGGGGGGGLLGGLLGGGGGGLLGGLLGGGSQQVSTTTNTQSISTTSLGNNANTNSNFNAGLNSNFNSATDLNSQLNSIRFIKPKESSSISTTVNRRRVRNTDVDWLDEQFDGQTNNNNIDDIQDEQTEDLINNSQSNTRTTNTRRTRNGGLDTNIDLTFLPNNRQQTNRRIRTNINTNTNTNTDTDTNIGFDEQDGDTLNQDDINNLLTSTSTTTTNNRRDTSRNSSNNRINIDNISVNPSNPSNIRRAANNQRTTNTRTDISRDLINAMRNNNMPDVEVNGRVFSGQDFMNVLKESEIFINGQRTSPESLIRALNGEQNMFVNGLDRGVRVNQRRVDPRTMTDISTGDSIDVQEDGQYQTVQVSDQNA